MFITYKDRFSRVSFDIWKQLFKTYNCEIIVINDINEQTDTSDKEIFEDIVSLLHCFAMKMYSNRRKKKINIVEDDLKNTIEDTNELYSVTDYECTGSNGIDTGIKFFEYDNISAECTVTGVPDTQVNNATLIGIIDESGSPWPGIALNNNNDTLQKYKFAGYRVRTIDILMSDENEHTFKITKLGKTLKLYADGVNVDNVTITDEKLEQCKASSINVCFGYAGEYLNNGNPVGRYWKGTIKSASVYIEDITAFTQEQSDESNSEEFIE